MEDRHTLNQGPAAAHASFGEGQKFFNEFIGPFKAGVPMTTIFSDIGGRYDRGAGYIVNRIVEWLERNERRRKKPVQDPAVT